MIKKHKLLINIKYIKKFTIIIFFFFIVYNIINKNEYCSEIFKNNSYKNITYNHFFYRNKLHNLSNKKFLINYSFRALYISKYKNEIVQLINKIYENYIEKIFIDNGETTETSFYSFLDPGLHEILIKLKMEKLNSSEKMFSDISNLLLIDANPDLDYYNLESMREMFKNCILIS